MGNKCAGLPLKGEPRTLLSVINSKVSKVYTGRKRLVGRAVAQPDAVPIEAVRRLAAVRAEATSVNRVAMEIGITARGLSLFLSGSAPYAPTRAKLLRWYVREVDRDAPTVDAETARAALHVLMHALSPERREAVEQQAISWWARLYEMEGVAPLPGWLAELRQPGTVTN